MTNDRPFNRRVCSTFAGLRVVEDPRLVEQRTVEKRWKRLNRPDKVRRRVRTVASDDICLMPGMLVAHPETIAKLKEQLDGMPAVRVGMTNV